ncbi:hypothetical protein BD310DRAFT_920435 [Dichomitus squalens]|uniref:Uncharacterized protein n=1 Tax=Dichomitus squalens TaxID=114155 RepID=A0A4Q9Q3Z5_9APHY|nr:hypothetical protein BD310DRAFT_920435 [Dichomitus squalens]
MAALRHPSSCLRASSKSPACLCCHSGCSRNQRICSEPCQSAPARFSRHSADSPLARYPTP